MRLLFKASSRRWCLEPKAICGESSCNPRCSATSFCSDVFCCVHHVHKKKSSLATDSLSSDPTNIIQRSFNDHWWFKKSNWFAAIPAIPWIYGFFFWFSVSLSAHCRPLPSLGPKALSSRSKSRMLAAPSASAMSKSCPATNPMGTCFTGMVEKNGDTRPGQHAKNYRKSPCFMGKSTINRYK